MEDEIIEIDEDIEKEYRKVYGEVLSKKITIVDIWKEVEKVFENDDYKQNNYWEQVDDDVWWCSFMDYYMEFISVCFIMENDDDV